jgi:hypothetical protein
MAACAMLAARTTSYHSLEPSERRVRAPLAATVALLPSAQPMYARSAQGPSTRHHYFRHCSGSAAIQLCGADARGLRARSPVRPSRTISSSTAICSSVYRSDIDARWVEPCPHRAGTEESACGPDGTSTRCTSSTREPIHMSSLRREHEHSRPSARSSPWLRQR